ncbi:MAG: GNAT family N-acetyltransferase, partial [Clostridia bacterium]|nr:GNAT family N-acetyltransferase [Clostridia bacterium]
KDGYCGNGYMTEAVTAVSNWALEQNGIIRVDAETAPDNTASQNVLIRAGFSKNGEIGEEGPRFSRYKEKGEK